MLGLQVAVLICHALTAAVDKLCGIRRFKGLRNFDDPFLSHRPSSRHLFVACCQNADAQIKFYPYYFVGLVEHSQGSRTNAGLHHAVLKGVSSRRTHAGHHHFVTVPEDIVSFFF